ncbi:MAG TPA: HupE/UreJ family protein [Burkholderiales bacterium]|nr:HupE/UreJ family protein [Burkholderiales bacterium]
MPALAQAHHFMGGRLPRSWMEGFLSGLGHPVIGVDHFAFVVAAGFLLAFVPRGLWALVALIAGALVGAALHLSGGALPGAEAMIAVSVICVGVLVAFARPWPTVPLAALLALAGVLHGYAYAESIFGAEPAPLAAYLGGFSLIQLALGAGAFFIQRRLGERFRRPVALALGGAASALGALSLLA